MMGVANDEDGHRRGVPDQFEHMTRHDAWWKRSRVRLKWEPIATLPKDLGDLALAEPVILRSANQWALGHWYEDGWIIVTAGGHSRLDHFRPFQWAEPTVDDHMLLAQE